MNWVNLLQHSDTDRTNFLIIFEYNKISFDRRKGGKHRLRCADLQCHKKVAWNWFSSEPKQWECLMLFSLRSGRYQTRAFSGCPDFGASKANFSRDCSGPGFVYGLMKPRASGSRSRWIQFVFVRIFGPTMKLNSISEREEINHAIKQLRTNPCLWKCISGFHLDVVVCTLFQSARNSAHRESEDWMKMSNNKHKQQRLISSTLRPTFRLISFTHFAPFHFFFSAPQRRYSIKASDEMAFAAFAIEPRFGRGARRRRMMEAKKSIRRNRKSEYAARVERAYN